MRTVMYRLRQHPVAYWTAVAAAALAAGRIGALVPPAGRVSEPVPVAARALDAGTVLRASDVAWRRWPVRLLPRAQLAHTPIGRTALVRLAAGEALLASRLSPGGGQGAAALLPPGDRALSVPIGDGALTVHRGDLVDILATFDLTDPLGPASDATSTAASTDPAVDGVTRPPDGGGDAGRTVTGGGDVGADPTVTVAAGALVIDVTDRAVTLAVPVDVAPRVAFALASGKVTLTLAPPGPSPHGD